MRRQRDRVRVRYRRAVSRVFSAPTPYRNREGFRNFDFMLAQGRVRPGVSALLRIRNEAPKLPYVLASMFELFDEIVLVDNASDDDSARIAREFKERQDRADRLKLYAYPFTIARYGAEHAATPETSVHSVVYYYNWALAQCACRYVCKWDGDMVIKPDARRALAMVFRETQAEETCWILRGQTVYRDAAGRCYLAPDETNGEVRLFPNGNARFYKADPYEVLAARPALPQRTVPEVTFYELKFVDEDEFSHWTPHTTFVTDRKKREWESFQMVQRGELTPGRFEALPSTFLDQVGSFDPGRATRSD